MTKAPDFRKLARQSLILAKAELSTNAPNRTRYAALELRLALEALTYDRALAFKDEIPPEEFKTWQPRKLMAVLVEIDETIGKSSTISAGREEVYGVQAPRKNMRLLGTDNIATPADLKKHYDALGSFLHMPSLEQVRSGKIPDMGKLRERCEAVVELVDKVFSSRVWNVTLGTFAVLPECMNELCKKPIRRRIPVGKNEAEARCFDCGAEYRLTVEPEGKIGWRPRMTEMPCSTVGCERLFRLWPHEIKPGTHWRCLGCGAHNGISLTVGAVAHT